MTCTMAWMTEREAWTAIADTLEMTGEMPPFNLYEPCVGLHAIVHVMWRDGIISNDTRFFMREQMSYAWVSIGENQFAPYGEVKPRIQWARIFADSCE